jgi:hypothetical protein
VSFSAFADEPIAAVMSDASAASRLTVLLGAGASVEAGLPSWPALLDRLLRRAGVERGLIDPEDPEQVRRWVDEAVRRDGYLGAAAVVEALIGDRLQDWIPEALYGSGKGASDYFPGPICRQLPLLRRAFGDRLRLLTTNYDDLPEQAFRDDDELRLEPLAVAEPGRSVPDGAVEVVHLHGYLGRDGDQGSSCPRPIINTSNAGPPGKRSKCATL